MARGRHEHRKQIRRRVSPGSRLPISRGASILRQLRSWRTTPTMPIATSGRESTTCRTCGHVNRGDAKFCEECGTRVGRFCDNCGAELSATAKFCPQCGQAVTSWKPSAAPRIARVVEDAPEHHAEATIRASTVGDGKPTTSHMASVELSPLPSPQPVPQATTFLDRVLARTLNRCPACDSSRVRRSHLRADERGTHGWRSPYRCEDCQTRYWVLSRKARLAFVSGAVSVVFAALLVALAVIVPSAPSPVVAADEPAANQVLLPISSMPDQVENETHRLELLGTPTAANARR